MPLSAKVVPLLLLSGIAGCQSDVTTDCCTTGEPALRIINAFTTPVDVLIDGNVAIGSLAAGAIDTLGPAVGSHTLVLRPAGSGASVSRPITTTTGALSTIAVVQASSGAIGSAVLDDTNSVVPPGATKLRVLHLAPSAGPLQVYRTQPDYQQPTQWQFPFEYQPEPTSLTAPFYQSTVGSWEVRVWQTPADASGWANAQVKIVIPLGSGEKKTILILDKPGGGIRIELL
jgi:Domain of unknown function (DUF4397)